MVVVQHSNPKTRDATIQSACPRDLAVEEVNWPKGSYLISFKLESNQIEIKYEAAHQLDLT